MVPRHIIRRCFTSLFGVILLFTAALPASGQVPPRDFENLKVLSPEMGHRQLIDLMKSYSRALGVRCEHCHVGEAGAPFETAFGAPSFSPLP